MSGSQAISLPVFAKLTTNVSAASETEEGAFSLALSASFFLETVAGPKAS